MKKIIRVFLMSAVLITSIGVFNNYSKISAETFGIISLDVKEEFSDNFEVAARQRRHFYLNGVELRNGIWQLKSTALCPNDMFDWTDNGIPLACIEFTDRYGNRMNDQQWRNNGSQNYFRFIIGTISYTGANGYNSGHRFFQYNSSGGTFWTTWGSVDLLYYQN